MSCLTLKVQTKSGQQIIKSLTSESTINDLKLELSKCCRVPVSQLYVLTGYPPRPFDISRDYAKLGECDISTGDTLILEEKSTGPERQRPPTVTNNISSIESRPHVTDNEMFPGILMKHIVPADNSCLFSSIHYVLNGKIDSTGSVAPWMRQLIAETVSKDPENFSEAILGKPNAEYCKWIQDEKSWGGAIELAILSNHYGIEIAVVDTINAIINRFGEDQHYPHRVLLLFDGIHYDPLYLEPLEGGNIQTIFPSEDERILREAEQLAKEAKSSRQFTDVNRFTVKCLECNVMMNGQVQATQHAQSTGHMNFGEV